MPTPIPTPWDATAEWWWPWLTDVLIPVLGVAASTAVAIAALLVSRRAHTLSARAREMDAQAREMDTRAEYGALVTAYVNRAKGDRNPTILDLRREALTLNPTASEIPMWVASQEARRTATISAAPTEARLRTEIDTKGMLVALTAIRVETWIRTGHFDIGDLAFRISEPPPTEDPS